MAGFVGNKYYNDPNLGRVAAGLSSLFAPPAARDIAAMNQDKRLQMLFESGADPSASSALIGVQGYGDTPTGFGANLRSLESRNAYTADTAAAAQRYGYDRGLEGTKYVADQDLRGAIFDTSYGPLDPGQVRPAVPADEAAMFGLPGGIAGAAGAPKPLTTDEVEAALMQELVDNDPNMRLAYGLNNLDREKIVGPNGPVLTFGGMAAAAGAEPYVNKGAEAAPETANYAAPGGVRGTAYFDRADNTFKDTQTGAPIPPGSQVFKAQAQGSAADVVGPTKANVTRGNETIATADYGLQRLQQFRALLQQNPGVLGLPGMVRGLAQDLRAGVTELTGAYGDIGEQYVSPEQIDALAQRLGASSNYDPAIAQARAMALEMAYMQAKMQDPSGEVNVRELERMLGIFDGGIAGNVKVLAALDVLEKQLADRKGYGAALNGSETRAGTPPADPIAQARDAIAKGADAAAVRQRLIDNGITPPGDM